MEWWQDSVDEKYEEGREEGREEGKDEGYRLILLEQLETKFGRVPKRARERVRTAPTAHVLKWAKKVVTAESLEGVLGPRERW